MIYLLVVTLLSTGPGAGSWTAQHHDFASRDRCEGARQLIIALAVKEGPELAQLISECGEDGAPAVFRLYLRPEPTAPALERPTS